MGCKEDELCIKIRYDQVQDLKEGDRVIFEENHIGNVTGVFYSAEGYYVITLVIKRHFANAANEHSKFFIIEDPKNEGKKAVEVIQIQRGGSPLQDGATVQGSTKSSAVLGQMRENVEKGLENLKEQFEQFFEDLRSIPETEDFKKLEKELERLTEEMKRSSKSVREKIQKELLPRIREKIEELREQFRKFGREEELEPLETQMERITDI